MSYIRLSNEKRHSAFSRLQNTLKYHVFFFSAAPLFRPAGSGKSPSFPFDRSMTTLSPRCDPQTLSFTIRPFRSPPSPLHDTRRTPRRAPAKTPLPPPSCRQRQDSLRPAACPIPQRGRTAAGPGGTVAENRIGERRNKEETDGKEKRPGSGPHRPPHGEGNGPPKDSGAPAIGKNGPPHAGPRSRCAGRGFRGAPPRTGEAEPSWTRPQCGPPRTARPHAGEPSSARTATTRTTKGSEKRAGERRVAPPRLRRGFPPTPFRGASARRWGRRRRRNPGPRGRHWRRRTP